MNGKEAQLVALMQGSSKRFIIPVYQRNYDWNHENCKQLFDDLIKIKKTGRKNHFFGSIVSVYSPDGVQEEFLIIDGQQRITTVSLLLLAIYNALKSGKVTSKDDNLRIKIYEEYLVDRFQKNEARIKLKHIKNDQKAFSKLFEDEQDYIQSSNLTINYKYFFERIQREEISVDELFDAICRLQIINITLNSDDNPQLIFESLNSTGKALSEGDKIRNFILMGLPTEIQNIYYEKYWNMIENCTRCDVSSFVRDYLSVKQLNIPSINNVYTTFKIYVEESNVEIEKLLIDMLDYAKWYEILLNGNTKDGSLNACIKRLNRLETTVARPFLLEVLRISSREDELNRLSEEQVRNIFSVIESYIFRRTICDLPTNSLNKIFLTLNRDICKYDGTTEDYVDKLKYTLGIKREKAKYPDDDEFIDAFTQKQVYLMQAKNKVYILERFENYGTKEDKDIYAHVDDGTYSIEHIMPQHLTSAWVDELGDDYESIHETWMHRIANLTLTAYNSKYSNNSFTEKKTMENGFEDSGIRMNTYIAKKEKWTLEELEERNNMLMERALQIWGSCDSSFKPAEKPLDSFTLDDEFDVRGRSISKFSFRNMEQPVASWAEAYEIIIRLLHVDNKSVLYRLSEEKNVNPFLTAIVNNKPQELRAPIQIDTNLFVEKNRNTESKLSILQKLFALYDENPMDLIFYLKEDEAENEDEEGLARRHNLRRRYWSYALEFVHKAHGEKGTFRNVHTTKANSISGFIGVNGVRIACVANYDSARVSIYIAMYDVEEGKVLFDKLLKNKTTIENKLGIQLIWNRNDEYRRSEIYYEDKSFGLENENSWEEMAKFHAKWSKEFYDTFVPIIRGVFLK